jgi:hypothetical protein
VRALENFNPVGNSTCDLFSAGEVFLNQLKCFTFTENLEENNFIIYPNPANSYVIVDIDHIADSNNTITIFDIYGKKLFEEKINKSKNNIVIDIKMFPKGFYLIELKDSYDNISYRKIVKE